MKYKFLVIMEDKADVVALEARTLDDAYEQVNEFILPSGREQWIHLTATLERELRECFI